MKRFAGFDTFQEGLAGIRSLSFQGHRARRTLVCWPYELSAVLPRSGRLSGDLSMAFIEQFDANRLSPVLHPH